MKRNVRVRCALTTHSMKQWQLADLIGISEFTLSRKLRYEMPAEEQDRLIEIIEKNSN